MNFDILQKAIPDETMRAFLDKNVRYDNRQFTQERNFIFTKKVFDSFSHSAIGSLGLNKIILVLKENNELVQNNESRITVQIENFESSKPQSISKIYNYVNKLISNNIEINSQENNKKTYTLFITIESSDGNVYDTISNSILNFFNEENNDVGIRIKNKFVTKSFCIFNDDVLIDPGRDEEKLADIMFNVIKFSSGEMYIHKIKGEFAKWNKIKEIANTITV